MFDYFLLFISTLYTQNFILNKFFGLCSFINISKDIKFTFGILFPTIFVIVLSSIFSWLINNLILIPLSLNYLRIFTLVLVISTMVQLCEILIRKFSIIIYHQIGIFLPLITTNCMIFFITLINVIFARSFGESLFFSIISMIGYFLITIFFSLIKERFYLANIPFPFQGAPVVFITIGLLSLILMVLIF